MLFDVLNAVARELPGCRMTSVVSLDTGLALASVDDGRTDAAGADAFHSQLYRLLHTTLRELGDESTVDDIVVEGPSHVFISVPLDTDGYFWHVVTSSETTLGFTQAVMRKHRDRVENGIADLLG